MDLEKLFTFGDDLGILVALFTYQLCIVDHACCSLNFPYHGHRGKKQNDQDNSGYHHQYTQHIRLLLFFLLTHSFPLGNLLLFKSNARETWHAIPGSFADIYLTESRFQFPMRSTGTLICSILLNFNGFCNKKDILPYISYFVSNNMSFHASDPIFPSFLLQSRFFWELQECLLVFVHKVLQLHFP